MHQFLQRDILLRLWSQIIFRLFYICISIYLIEDNHRRLTSGTQIRNCLIYHLNLFFKIRMRNINHMQQQVCFAHLIQRRFKWIHQIGRELTYKSYCIRQQERQIINNHLTHRCIESSKQLIFGKDLTLRQQIHQRWFSDIRISDQCHTNQSSTVLALGRLLCINIGQTLFQQCHTIQDNTTVHFQLRFTRTTKSHRTFTTSGTGTTTLTFQVCPQTLQSGQHIFILCQLYLRFGIGSLRAHSKNIKNKWCTVQNLYIQFLFDISYLFGRKFIIEDHHTHIFTSFFVLLKKIFLNFLQLTLSNISHGIGSIQFLSKTFYNLCSGCFGQKSKFIQIFIRFTFILRLGNQSHQRSLFSLSFWYNKFFHSV